MVADLDGIDPGLTFKKNSGSDRRGETGSGRELRNTPGSLTPVKTFQGILYIY